MENYDYNPDDEVESPKKDNRAIIGIAAVLIIFLCLCLVVVGVVAADPFNWNLLGFLSRGGGAAVTSMPESTEFYIGLDMDNFTPQAVGRIVDPFLGEMPESEFRSFADFLRAADDELDNAAGFTLEDDVLPWIGPGVGIGLIDYRFDQFGGPEEMQLLVAAETRDRDASDDFIEKLIEGLEDSSGDSFRDEEYEGVTIYELDSDFEGDRIAVARSGDIVYLGTGINAIEDGIDAQDGSSLVDDEEYRALERQMPSDRAVTIYVSSNFIEDSTSGLASEILVDPSDVPLIRDAGGALTISFAEAGLQLDILALLDTDNLSDEERSLLQGSDAETADMFPEDTVLYFTGASINQFWEAIAAASPDYEEALDELERDLGFDLIRDLVVFLDGETGLGLWPSSRGVLAESADLDLGFAVLAGTSNENEVETASDDLVDVWEQQFMIVDKGSAEGVTTYSVSEDFTGYGFTYGLGDGYFFIASGDDAVEEVFGSGPKLADSDRYRSVWSEFPRGTSPVLYLDLENFVDAMGAGSADAFGFDDEGIRALSPLSIIAAGTDFGGDVSRVTVILFVDTN